jgi:hypothetical protein
MKYLWAALVVLAFSWAGLAGVACNAEASASYRFQIVHSERHGHDAYLIVRDTYTNQDYLVIEGNYGRSMTPLLGEDDERGEGPNG